MELKGSKTEQNLKDAFAGESQANRRYLYFASKADVEGYNDVAAVFRSTAEGETGQGHQQFFTNGGPESLDHPIHHYFSLFVISQPARGHERIYNYLFVLGMSTNNCRFLSSDR